MTDRPIENDRDRLVAALLGELNSSEMNELESAIKDNDDLRRDWEDLQLGQRAAAAATSGEAETFTFTWPEGPASANVQDRGMKPLLAAAAGFLLAVTLFSALLLLGLRVDRGTGSLTITFGQPFAADLQPATAETADGFSERDLALAQLLSIERPSLSRDELAVGLQAVLKVTAARFDNLERRQAENQVVLSRALYDALANDQQRQLESLTAQIQLVALDGDSRSWNHRDIPSSNPANDIDRQGDYQ